MQEMLLKRHDTPRRLAKHAARGFSSFVAGGALAAECQTRFDLAVQHARLATNRKYLNVETVLGPSVEETLAAQFLVDQGRAYSETRLPRGWGITPATVTDFLQRVGCKAETEGREPMTSLFVDGDEIGVEYKLDRKLERWATWGVLKLSSNDNMLL